MTLLRRADLGPSGLGRLPVDGDEWLRVLATEGRERDEALRRLHGLLLHAARHQVRRMRAMLPGAGADQIEDLAHQSADEAMVALLGKLATFEGRSRFTTWAYKFAVLQAATEVRREAWRHREVVLDGLELVLDCGPSPEQYAEAVDLVRAVRSALDEVLTAYQRRIVLCLLVEAVPVDVLAERLGTNRGALYKTLHDARQRLRAHLAAAGYEIHNTARAGGR